MERVVALLCNPSAGGGRAARVLPEVEAAMRDLDVSFRTVTRDLEHARALARAAVYGAEVVATLGGDGLAGCVAGAVREIPGAKLGVLPGGRGNDLARVLKIPSELRGACQVIAAGRERELDVGEIEGTTFVGIASVGFDSDANRIANEAAARLGRAPTSTAACAHWRRGARRAFRCDSTASRWPSPATRSRPPSRRPTAAAC